MRRERKRENMQRGKPGRQTEKQTSRQIQTDRQTQTQKNIQIMTERSRRTDRQTDKHNEAEGTQLKRERGGRNGTEKKVKANMWKGDRGKRLGEKERRKSETARKSTAMRWKNV